MTPFASFIGPNFQAPRSGEPVLTDWASRWLAMTAAMLLVAPLVLYFAGRKKRGRRPKQRFLK
jgi:hypothetical protein